MLQGSIDTAYDHLTIDGLAEKAHGACRLRSSGKAVAHQAAHCRADGIVIVARDLGAKVQVRRQVGDQVILNPPVDLLDGATVQIHPSPP